MTSIVQVRDWVKNEITKVWQLGIIYVAASMVMVQGASLITQFVLAGVLGPSDFAIVKVVENILRLLLIPAMAGIPSALIKYVAEEQDEVEQSKLLTSGVGLSAAISLLLALATVILAPALLGEDPALSYVNVLIWSLVFTAIVRTVISFYQGRRQMRRLATYNVTTVFISLALSIGGGLIWGLNGWAGGRFLGELLSVLIVIIPVRSLFLLIWDRDTFVRLISFGGVAVIALLFDRLVQMGDVIVLVRDGSIQSYAIGVYGLATTLFTALSLPVAATMMTSYPLLAQQDSVLSAWKLAAKLLWRVAVLSVGVAILAYIVGPWLIEMIWGEPFADSAPFFQAFLPLFVVNSLLSVLGTYSFSIGKPVYSVFANLAGFIVFIVFSSFAVSYFQVFGMIVLLTTVSLVRLLLFIVMVAMSVKHQTSTPLRPNSVNL